MKDINITYWIAFEMLDGEMTEYDGYGYCNAIRAETKRGCLEEMKQNHIIWENPGRTWTKPVKISFELWCSPTRAGVAIAMATKCREEEEWKWRDVARGDL